MSMRLTILTVLSQASGTSANSARISSFDLT